MADAEATRAALEEALDDYRGLIGELAVHDLERKLPGEWRKVRHVAWHVASAVRIQVRSVESVRRGKGFNPPAALMPALLRLGGYVPKIGARGATQASMIDLYERNHRAALAALDTVRDDEWSRASTVMQQHLTVEGAFLEIPKHLHEHAEEIRSALR